MKKIGVFLRMGSLFLSLLLVVGCGTFGGTRIVDVRLSSPPTGSLAQMEVGSVTLGDNATRLDAVAVLPVGEFSANDLNNMKVSLRNAFQSIQRTQGGESRRKLTVHVLVRRYLVTASNNAGATLACVAWCAVNEDARIVCDEQFYASASVVMFGTLGGIKNKVNLAIVSRIAETSAYLASLDSSKGPQPPFPENAYGDFAAATKNLPPSFRSTHFASGGGYIAFGTFGRKAEWTWAKRADGVDWAEYIKTHGSETKQ